MHALNNTNVLNRALPHACFALLDCTMGVSASVCETPKGTPYLQSVKRNCSVVETMGRMGRFNQSCELPRCGANSVQVFKGGIDAGI
jgi:hypothetical protein